MLQESSESLIKRKFTFTYSPLLSVTSCRLTDKQKHKVIHQLSLCQSLSLSATQTFCFPTKEYWGWVEYYSSTGSSNSGISSTLESFSPSGWKLCDSSRRHPTKLFCCGGKTTTMYVLFREPRLPPIAPPPPPSLPQVSQTSTHFQSNVKNMLS